MKKKLDEPFDDFIPKKKKKSPGHFYKRNGYSPIQEGVFDLYPPYGWNYLLGFCEDDRNLRKEDRVVDL